MNCASHPKNRAGESGNVLFYILIAVALLAALSYAVSSSSRGSMSQLDAEKARLGATEIMEYADVLAKATAQLRLRGCDATELSFENSVTTTTYTNTANPTGDNTCHLFHVSGGGVQYRVPDTTWLDNSYNSEDLYGEFYFPRNACVVGIGAAPDSAVSCQLGNDHADLIVMLPFLNVEICNEINSALGHSFTTPPVDGSAAISDPPTPFIGAFGNPLVIRDGAGALDRLTTACFRTGGGTTPSSAYVFYKVLAAR